MSNSMRNSFLILSITFTFFDLETQNINDKSISKIVFRKQKKEEKFAFLG